MTTNKIEYENELLKEANEELLKEKEEYRKILMSVSDGVISFSKNGEILFMNPLVEKLTGICSDVGIGMQFDSLVSYNFEYNEEDFSKIYSELMAGKSTYKKPSQIKLIDNDGKEYTLSFTASTLKDSSGNIEGAVILFRDVSKEVEKIAEIEFLSYHDQLTGVYNRHYLEKTLENYDFKKYLPLTIMVVDINGLKLTNDAFGHVAGDKLIIETAKILKSACREEDIICRVGGDEFAIVMPNLDSEKAQKVKEDIISKADKTKIKSGIISLAIGYSVRKYISQHISVAFKEADNQMYRYKAKSGKLMRSQTIETVLRSINNKYDKEQIHTEKVSEYCELIAKALNMSEKEVSDAKKAGILHDIGKITISPDILNKEGKLTEEEYKIVKRHTNYGYQILKSVDEYANLAESILYHHEWYDGSGYPEGLSGDKIPLIARIIAVADAYEAMTTDRSYQKARSKKEALDELVAYSNKQFDKKIVDIFVNIMKDE